MDGGLDAAIRDALGFAVQQRAQRVIVERHHGELPVGAAELVETGDARWPVLVLAPTMRIPESVAQTLNAYLAFRAVLLACKRANIASVVCCGLGTGIGGMEPRRSAVQMRMALLSRDWTGAHPVFRSDPRDAPCVAHAVTGISHLPTDRDQVVRQPGSPPSGFRRATPGGRLPAG